MMGAVESWGAIVAESGRMSGSIRLSGDSNVFSRSCREVGDEEALKWAALEKLPTYNRMRRAILKGVVDEDGSQAHKEVNVAELSFHERQSLINKILRVTEEDNERFLLKLRDRIDKVGIDLPKIEVRFEHLTVNADIYVGSRTLPTLFNFSMNMLEGILSWFHLSLTKKRDLNILCNVSGIIKPSRMTLLLGPPTSGKTTLLLALAGKLDPDLRVSGVVTYNGHMMDEFVPQRTSAYISQHDLHIGEMTVRETLDFCGRCLGVGSRYGFGTVLEMLMELSRREKEIGIKPDPDIDVFMKAAALSGQETSLISDYVLKILGLDICADILVGDNLQRGISGGQKKRVTTGEILVGPAKALFMDEISTGLDSSTTYQIVKCLRHTVHVLDGTILVSLLQPAPETFDLFDDLILLSEGQIVYQGPRDLVLDFFESMGFKCPERKGTADFLQEVTSRKDQGQYWVNTSMPYRYIPVKEFAEAFKSFHVGQSLAEEVAVPFDKLTSHPAALSMEKYGLSKWELLKACFAREWLLIKRNMFVYVFNFIQISFTAFVTMTLFLRTELQPNTIDDGNLYMGALFFALVTAMFNGFAELSMTVFRLPVFYKQRDLLLYPAWAFSLPTWIMRVPISLLEAGIWTGSTYYVIGFAPEPERFFRQYFLLFCVHQMSQGLFRLIASVGRTMVLSNTFGPFMLLIIFVLSGFVISRDDIHVWWIWVYWISPMMYGYNAICVNEFLSPRWNKPNNNSSVDEPTIGRAILRSRGIFPDAYWYWLGIGALLGFTVLFNVLFTVALAYLNPLGKPQAIIPEDILQEKHANLTGENITESSRSKSHQRLSPDHTTAANKGIELPARQLSMSFIASLDDAVEAKGMAPERGMVLPFQPLWMAFHNINYFVDMPAEMKKQGEEQNRLQLLQNVSGIFRPGVLTALVGVSGAGKTTLMDVLAGRKTGGYIEGTISISGYPKNQETFTRISGYCEQNDIHSPSVTVEESLIFSAWLHLPKDIDADTRKRFVKEVMDLVELTPLRNAMVGLPGVSGLSMEQRKRLTIAVELVANPSIIFMDEPTSGLDARAAAIVMRTVRNTVDTGRTIVCTIHQPSIDIFEAFNELLLMKCGGRVIYSGTLGRCSHRLVEYFEAIPGVPKIKEGYNPATWMLEVSSQSTEEKLSIDFADLYNKSSNHQHTEALIEELNKEAPGSKDIHFPTKYSQTFFMQCIICLWKQNHSYWRKPEYNIARFFFTTVSALSFGSIYWDLGKKMSKQQDLINVIGALYAAVLFIGVNNSSAAQPVVAIERIVFYRERAAGMYSALPYAFAQVLVEMPYVFVQTLVYSIIVYSMVAFQWTVVKCCWFIFFMFFTFMYFTTYGMMTVGVTPNFHFAAIIAFAFYILWNLFSGFVIPQTRIPMWWRWYYWANPVSWSLYGLITSQLGDVDDLMLQIPGESEPKSVSKYIHDYLGYDYDFLGVVAGMHVAIAVLFALIFGICIKYLNFQRR